MMLHIALLSFFFVAKFIVGQNPKFLHPLTNRPGSSKDVVTRFHLPEHQDKKFPIGKTSTILCHISNDGKTPYNVTAIMGSLNQMKTYYFIQNFTYKPVGVMVLPGEELTLHYDFELNKELEAMEFTLSHTLFYSNDRHRGFSTTFYNKTIELYYPATEWDMESILQALVGILFTILVAAGSIYVCAPDFAQKYIDQWNGMSNTPSMNSAVKPTSGPSQTTGASDWDDVILVGGPKQQKKAGHKK